MKTADFKKFCSETFEKRMSLMLRKNNDYSGDADFLSNFKRVSTVLSLLTQKEIKPSDYALMLIMLKIDRECNLRAKNLAPNNESRRDTLIDLRNYIDLYEACCAEE